MSRIGQPNPWNDLPIPNEMSRQLKGYPIGTKLPLESPTRTLIYLALTPLAFPSRFSTFKRFTRRSKRNWKRLQKGMQHDSDRTFRR